MKRFMYVLLLILNILNSYPQEYKEITPFKSPQVSDLLRIDKFQDPLFTGHLDLSVNLMNIETPDMNIPITLRYNSGGFMPNKSEDIVGLDWSLCAGGFISREIKGCPDDKLMPIRGSNDLIYGIVHKDVNLSNISTEDYFKNPSSKIQWVNDEPYILDANKKKIDISSDIYHFNFMGLSGEFSINFDKTVNVIERNGVRLRVNVDSIGVSQSIRVQDDKGNTYYFGGGYDNCEYEAFLLINSSLGSRPDNQIIITSWHLYKIVSNNGETINFKYKKLPSELHNINNSMTIADHLFTNKSSRLCYNIIETQSRQTSQIYAQSINNLKRVSWDQRSFVNKNTTIIKKAILEEIVFPNGSVLFYYSEKDRLAYDFYQTATAISSVCPYMLDSLCLISADKQIRRAELGYTYRDNRAFLNQVRSYNGEVTTFSYKNTTDLPKRSTFQTDNYSFWTGYLDSALHMKYLSTNGNEGWYKETGVLRRFFDEALINKVSYSTGGYEVFYYEPHMVSEVYRRNFSTGYLKRYSSESLGSPVGGVRLRQRIKFDTIGNVLMRKSYKYSSDLNNNLNEESSGVLDTKAYLFEGSNNMISVGYDGIPYSNISDNHVIYKTIYAINTEEEKIDKRLEEYKYYGPFATVAEVQRLEPFVLSNEGAIVKVKIKRVGDKGRPGYWNDHAQLYLGIKAGENSYGGIFALDNNINYQEKEEEFLILHTGKAEMCNISFSREKGSNDPMFTGMSVEIEVINGVDKYEYKGAYEKYEFTYTHDKAIYWEQVQNDKIFNTVLQLCNSADCVSKIRYRYSDAINNDYKNGKVKNITFYSYKNGVNTWEKEDVFEYKEDNKLDTNKQPLMRRTAKHLGAGIIDFQNESLEHFLLSKRYTILKNGGYIDGTEIPEIRQGLVEYKYRDGYLIEEKKGDLGNILTTTYKYAADTLLYSDYVKATNRYSLPLQITQNKNGNMLSVIDYSYSFKENLINRRIEYVTNRNKDKLLNKEVYYDSHERPFYQKDRTNKEEYCIWGYNHSYPVLQIADMKLTQFKAKFSDNEREQFSKIQSPTVSEINKIREKFKDVMVYSYIYEPLVGVRNVCSPNNLNLKFDYDLFGRLNKETDHKGNTTRFIEYKYFNE